MDYYKKAYDYIIGEVSNPEFYLFTDNIHWCKENLPFINANYIDWNPKKGNFNYIDMQLMSMCKNNIIANSTYSWWAAWLNNSPGKCVIAPVKWFNNNTIKYSIDILLPENWIKILT